jgi:hypothetical protein
MITRSWIRNLFARTPRTVRKALAPCRPHLEFLEDRTAPAVIVVNSTDDILHYSTTVMISDLSPATTSITLRDAINAANNTGGSNVIDLVANTTYNVSCTNVDNFSDGPNALPAISSDITIEGNGAILNRTDTGTATTDALRFFYVAGGLSGLPAGTLTLNNLTLQNGLASGAGASAQGGAIYSQGTLTLDTATVQNNMAQGVGGVVGFVAGSGGGGAASGGGVYVAGGSATLSHDILSGNTAQGGSGGNGETGFFVGGGTFYNAAGSGGTGSGGVLGVTGGLVTLSNDTLSGNTAQGGSGGQGEPSGNGGAAFGGGVYVALGNVSQSNDTLSRNSAHGGSGAAGVILTDAGGTGGTGSGGGLGVVGGSVTSSEDTLSGNTAVGGTGGLGGGSSSGSGTCGAGGSGGTGSGGGVCMAGGTVTLSSDTLSSNTAQGGTGGGGGSIITGTGATMAAGGAGGSGGTGSGGGLCVAGGSVTLSKDTLSSNTAQGGDGGFGGFGLIANSNATTGNSLGGGGGSGGDAFGGGLDLANGIPALSNVTINGNTAHGGSGGKGGGGAIFIVLVEGGPGNGGSGGTGSGGGVYMAEGSFTLSNETLNGNTAQGGTGGAGGFGLYSGSDSTSNALGGNGGTGSGGALSVAGGTVTLSNETLNGNTAQGGTGGAGGITEIPGSPIGAGGGTGLGGGVYMAGGRAILSNDTLSGNTAQGGTGGAGGDGYLIQPFQSGEAGNGGGGGPGGGGGVYMAAGSAILRNDTLSGNTAQGGTGGAGGLAGGIVGSAPVFPGPDGSGTGGGVFVVGVNAAFVANTLIAQNMVTRGSPSAPDVAGSVADGGNNLVGDGTGSNLSDHVNGDQVGTFASPIDPKLGPLSKNGGPTQTMALLPGSPAIDAGDNGLILFDQNTDQRGFARISGSTVDIGAFEYQYPVLVSTLPNGTYGAAYTQAITATGDGAPFTFTFAGGNLPPGLNLNADGTWSGTPTVLGPFSFTVTATDQSGFTTSQAYSIVIAQATPTVSVADASGTYSGNPFAASATVVGVDGVTAVSGSFSYAYYVGSSATGTPLGTPPTSAGTYTVVATFTSTNPDYTGGSAQTTFAISPDPTSISVSASNAAPVYGQSVMLTATVTTHSGSPIPTSTDGKVTFYVDGMELGPPQTLSQTLSSGSAIATVTTALLTASPHTITAVYSGDNDFLTSQTGVEPTTLPKPVPATGLNFPESVAVDSAGDVFIADTNNNQVVVLPHTGPQFAISQYIVASSPIIGVPPTLSNFIQPYAVAVDSAGDLFITDGTGVLVEMPVGGTPTAIGYGLYAPPGVAQDGQGDVFVAEPSTNQVVEIKADATVATVGSGLNQPSGVAVDAAGDVFIADSGNNRVVEMPAGLFVTVSPATPTVQVTDAGGAFNDTPFAASATVAGVVAGVDTTPAAQLEGVTPTLTYYAAPTASGTPLAGAPVLPGTYTVLASFAGSADYTAASATATFTIQAPPASITGPTTGVPGQPLSYTFAVSGPTQGITFTISYGDGASFQASAGVSTIQFNHVYTTTGSYTIQVMATDQTGAVSQFAALPVQISTVALETDPSGTTLAIGGTTGNDQFVLRAGSGGSWSAALNGQALGSYVPAAVMIYGDGGTNKVAIYGTPVADSFTIDPADVIVNGFTIAGDTIADWQLYGLGGNNTYTVHPGSTAQINGGAGGSNTLIGPNIANIWKITGPGRGLLDQTVAFGSIQNLDGGAGGNIFTFFPGGSVAGTIAGGGGNGNLLNYAAFAAPVTVNLESDTATGVGSFANIQSLVGAGVNDTLLGPNSGSAWFISGANTGNVAGVKFRSMENMVGGSGMDVFQIANGAGLSGSINGGGGGDWLDYHAWQTPVSVNLATGAATGVAGGVSNIQNVRGGQGGNTLTGDSQGNILVGGAGANVIQGGSGRSILIGGAGTDQVTGGSADDIIIAGSVPYATRGNWDALAAIFAEWQSADPYLTRINKIKNLGVGAANQYKLVWGSTVADNDLAPATLTGGGGTDWFFAKVANGGVLDTITNLNAAVEHVD